MFNKIDDVFLKLSDKIGDYLQEERGIPLPSIMFNCLTAKICLFVLFIMALWDSSTPVASMIFVGINILVWTPEMIMNIKEARAHAKNVHNWDEERVRKGYENAPLFSRGAFSALRMLLILVFIVYFSWALAHYVFSTMPNGRILLAASAFFFSVKVVRYTQTMIPKVPNVREHELKPIEVGI